nr:Rrf2 family transcriptional regulator [uncultured Holophaga sp.]
MSHTRFTVAIHTLTLLAFSGPGPQTSEFIAGSVNTNPVFIRRILARLRRAGLVGSQGGPGGGWQLLKAPAAITLKDVFQAIEDEPIFPLHSTAPNPRCPVGSSIQSILFRRFQDAQHAMEAELDRTSISQLAEAVGPF